MSDRPLISVAAALELVLGHTRALAAEGVALEAAADRYLAEPLVASLDLPPFANSALDGYALRHDDTPGTLTVAGESAAGVPFDGLLGPGQAVVISTGAVLPAGADAVAPIEWVRESADGHVEVPRAVPERNAIRDAGSDVAAGAELLAPGLRLGAAQLGVAASVGASSLRCRRLPSVAVLPTGSELRPAGEPLLRGQIYDSNGPMLRAAAASAGARVTVVPRAGDTHPAHRAAFAAALAHDVVISVGGVSVGGHDLVRAVQRELGVEEVFWRVAMKPGKPLSFGVRERPGQQPTLVFGLPGNPVSALVCFELFVRPALAALQGAAEPGPAFVPARLGAPVRRNAERDELIRVQRGADGSLTPTGGQQSHQLAAAALADGLAMIRAGEGTLPAGAVVDYLPLGPSAGAC